MNDMDDELAQLLSARVSEVAAMHAPAAAEGHGGLLPPVPIDADASVADALVRMVREGSHSLRVQNGNAATGSLDALDLLGWLARHPQVGDLEVEGASLEELPRVAQRIEQLVAQLHDSGLASERIGRRVADLNGRLFFRLWQLVAPPELVEASCLIVMGSEGRGEQTLRTDQDNALLLRDGVDPALAEAAALRFNGALIDAGYPPCDGNVMVSNPLWRQPLAEFRETIRDWLYGSDVDGVMQLAIFVDARAVAGDAGLLADARAYLDRIMADNAGWFARFASAIDLFPEPAGWWTRLAALAGREEPPLDLKKHGTFPIVHGVRSLALEYRIAATSTAERLRLLVEQQRLPAELSRDVGEVLSFLNRLKLQNNLRQRAAGQPMAHLVRPSELSLLDRHGLRDSLDVVHQLRQFLHQHYHLDAL